MFKVGDKVVCIDDTEQPDDGYKNWIKEWEGMPEFVIPTRDTPLRNSIDISDTKALAAQKTSVLPKYPIYIISKGRADKSYTAKALIELGFNFKVVVEPEEYESYREVLGEDKLLMLPFNNLGQGSIPARNWVLNHSRNNGDRRHWIMDDNINGFGYQKAGRRINTRTNGDFLRLCEDFVDRYKNIRMAGIRYRFHHNYVKQPYYPNTRIYSCILIDNSIQHEWRGRYNEDTDLSLRVLKDGDCTMLFTWCYCNKAGTQSVKGGNTDTVYKDTNDRLEFAKSLETQHPDVVKVVWRYNRWHHDVDYSRFRDNILVKV